ncbi:MAG: HD domain-containing protein [Phycisphaerae bacterium]|jgi:response regulator RpfG family c-di-GMP phosphodiesterase
MLAEYGIIDAVRSFGQFRLAPPTSPLGDSGAQPALVFLIDADNGAAERCAATLRAADHRAVRVRSVEELHIEPPESTAVILLDEGVPECAAIIAQLRAGAATHHVPIVLMCASNTGPPAHELERLCVDEVITKPVRAHELLKRVNAMAQLHALRCGAGRRAEQARMLTALLELTQGLVSAGDMDSAVQQLIATTVAVTGCRRVGVLLPDPRGQNLRLAGHTALSESERATACIPAARTASGAVLATGTPAIANDAQAGPLDIAPDEAPLLSDPPFLIMPLRASGSTVGVLTAAARLRRLPFAPDEIEMLELLANVGGSAIEEILSRHSRDAARDSIVFSLASLAEQRDQQTGHHLERVTGYCHLLAAELREHGAFAHQLDDAFLAVLEKAAPLHDIGKVAVPDAVLLKAGRLTPLELERMRSHTTAGWETLTSISRRVPDAAFLRVAADIAYAHHERYDGSGYPRGLRGEEIPLAARILTVADVYDALRSKRPYKVALGHDTSREIMLSEPGGMFDPAVVDAFLRVEREFQRLSHELSDDASESDDERPSPMR